MKKPELKDFERDVYDGADVAEWYRDYYEALEKYTEQLEYERQEHLKFMNGLASASPGRWEMSRDDFEAEFVIWAKNVAKDKIKTVRRKLEGGK